VYSMRLFILVDDKSGNICSGEHGFSVLIGEKQKILFDTGASDLFLKNAQKLNVNLEDISHIVLSHGHWDHGNGLKFIKNKRLVLHPGSFVKRYRDRDDSYIGLPLSLEEAKINFDLVLAKEPYFIVDDIVFLGEIPRNNDFEAKKTTWHKEDKEEDFVMDDSALAIKHEKGLIVIAGCSHSGICNIIEYAKEVTGLNKVYSVIGGFHLNNLDDVTNKTIEYFKKENIEKVYPSHCVSSDVVKKFIEELGAETIRSGSILNL